MIYVDTCVLIALHVEEDASDRVTSWFKAQTLPFCISDWTLVEFASALGIKVRTKQLVRSQADAVQDNFDTVFLPLVRVFAIDRLTYMRAQLLMRQYALGLRAGDALHLALCNGTNQMTLATSDRTLLRAARNLKQAAVRVS